MLNNRRIRIMTKLTTYEQKEGKEDIHLSKYYKSDYVRLQILKTILASTMGYLLLLVIIAIYKAEFLIENAVTLDYKALFSVILGYYIIILTISIIVTLIGYSIKYDRSRKHLEVYYRMLKKLRLMYKEEDRMKSDGPIREDI